MRIEPQTYADLRRQIVPRPAERSMIMPFGHNPRYSMFPPLLELGIPSDRGYFAECVDVNEVEDYNWPNPNYLHFDQCLKDLENAGDVYHLRGHLRHGGRRDPHLTTGDENLVIIRVSLKPI